MKFICDLVVYFKCNVYGVKSLLVCIFFFCGLLEGSKMINWLLSKILNCYYDRMSFLCDVFIMFDRYIGYILMIVCFIYVDCYYIIIY